VATFDLSKYVDAYDQQQAAVAREQNLAAQRLSAAQRQASSVDAEGNENILQKVGGWLGGGVERVEQAADFVWRVDDLSAVPVIGTPAKVAGEKIGMAAGWAGENYMKAVDGIAAIGSSVGLAANPNYWANRTAESDLFSDAFAVSPGQAWTAINDVPAQLAGIDTRTLVNQEGSVYQQKPDFNIADPAQRAAMFESGGTNQIASGLIDGLYGFYLDPLVVGGKGIKVFRFGTQAMGTDVVGWTSRKVVGAKVVKQIEAEAANTIQNITNGVTTDTVMLRNADRIVDGDFNGLRELDIFQGSNRDLLASIGATIKDKTEAIQFLAAASGSNKYAAVLRDKQTAVYAALQRAQKADPYETALLNTPVGARRPVLYDDLLENDFTAQQLLDDLTKRDKELHDMIFALDEQPVGLIENAGSRFVTQKRIADAWKDGRLARKDIKNRNIIDEANAVTLKTRYGTAPAAYEKIFQASSLMPRVRVWDWLGGYHASGYIDVRGFNTGKASDELAAALSDSKTIRRDGAFVREQMNIFGAALDPTSKMAAIRKIEQNVLKRLAEEASTKAGRKIDEDVLTDIYSHIDKRRVDTLDKFTKRGYAVDEAGELIKATPRLVSQLETNMPMLSMAMMEKTAKIAAKGAYNRSRQELKTNAIEAGKNLYDEIQSVWKASVLLRLGYTQRNTLEGWLRSAAYLGAVPALKNLPRSTANSFYNNYRRISDKSGYNSVRRLVDDETFLAKKIAQLEKEADDYAISNQAALARNPLSDTSISDMGLEDMRRQIDLAKKDLDVLRAKRENLQSRRYIGDDGAFSGKYKGYSKQSGIIDADLGFEHGDIVRRMSSAEKTNQNFLESKWMRDEDLRLSERAWGKIDPGKPQYWDELSQSVKQFKADPIASRVLAGETVGDIVAWARSTEGREWRRDMHIAHNEVEAKVVEISDMVNRYLPTPEAMAAAAAKEAPDPMQLQAVLGRLADRTPPTKPKAENFWKDGALDQEAFSKAMTKYDTEMMEYKSSVTLKPIHGREVVQTTRGLGAYDVYKNGVERLFRLLGTYPESTLVRHPFYAEVWQRRMNEMVKIADGQGMELTEDLLKKMNNTAHKSAMQQTNEILYTIERYSNPAAMMRWVAPFFAAWENSAKVWTKMVVNDPSILYRASLLWQIPNKLGMVVDENGEKVEADPMSFLTGSQNRFIVMPKAMSDVVEKFTGGVPIKIPQGALNVVTPGETPWLPGFGPVVGLAAGKFLATKPDVQKMLRDTLGEQLYSQIAPFGVPQDSLTDVLPAWARKAYQVIAGESDANYLQVADAMMQNAMVEWYKSGGNPDDKPDMEVVLKRTQDFYRFSIGASLILPFATTRASKYQQQVDYWRNLQSNQGLSYQDKVATFIKQFGDSYTPLITSTSKSDVPGLSPTIEQYNVLRDNSALGRELIGLGPDALGVLASSAPLGEFDEGVYQWMQGNAVEGMSDALRGRRNPQEVQNATIMQNAWREYRIEKEARDAELKRRGLTLEQNDAAGIKAAWQDFTDNQMVQKYGEQWVVAYNSYQNATPKYLTAIKMAQSDTNFMNTTGNSPLWDRIGTYTRERQAALDAIAAGGDSKAIRDAFAAWAADFKYSSLEFSDFYDRFLDQDTLQEYGIGNL
jgi:hypothetical protein